MKEIYTALLKFQTDCPKIKKDSENPFFKSKYAGLPAVWEVVQPLLAKHELLIIQPVVGHDLKTILIHSSGETIESTYPIISKTETNPQDYGSAIKYARRYALESLLGIVTDEDDDGNSAAGNVKKVLKANKPATTTPAAPATTQPPAYWELANNQLKEWVKDELLTADDVKQAIKQVANIDGMKLSAMRNDDIDKVVNLCTEKISKNEFDGIGADNAEK